MFFLSHLIYSFSVIYGNTQSLFYELFYELILNPKLEYLLKGLACILFGLRSALPLARARKPNNHIGG